MTGQVNDFADSVNRKNRISVQKRDGTGNGSGKSARAERIKNLHLCRVGAFENPLFSTGASRPGFGSHSKVGLQAPSVCWLPAGTPSVRQKDRQVTNTAEVMEAVADFHHQFIISSQGRQAPLSKGRINSQQSIVSVPFLAPSWLKRSFTTQTCWRIGFAEDRFTTPQTPPLALFFACLAQAACSTTQLAH
jgi:hypothetical protein